MNSIFIQSLQTAVAVEYADYISEDTPSALDLP